MASSAPEYWGERSDSPATWSLRRRTSKGWVNRSEVDPANPPQSSFRNARSVSLWSRSLGRIYDLTKNEISIDWILVYIATYKIHRGRNLRKLVSSEIVIIAEVSTTVWCYTDCRCPTTSIQPSDASLRSIYLLRHPHDPELGIFWRESSCRRGTASQVGSGYRQSSPNQIQRVCSGYKSQSQHSLERVHRHKMIHRQRLCQHQLQQSVAKA